MINPVLKDVQLHFIKNAGVLKEPTLTNRTSSSITHLKSLLNRWAMHSEGTTLRLT